jgi:hypothetical protein
MAPAFGPSANLTNPDAELIRQNAWRAVGKGNSEAMNDEFRKQRARIVRAMAEKADPFTKRRLRDLASRYEQTSLPPTPLPKIPADPVKEHSDLPPADLKEAP